MALLSGGHLHARDNSDTGENLKLVYQYQKRVADKLRHFGYLKYQELLDSDYLFGASRELGTASGLSYDLTQWMRVEGAVGLYYTWRPDISDIFEVRLWQAATFDWPDVTGGFRRYVVHHRFMLEERFKNVDDYDMQLRGRYRLSFSYPINRYTVQVGAFYLPLSAEFYVDGDDTEQYYAQKAQFSAGLGYVLDETWSLEFRLALEETRDTVDNDFQRSNYFFEFRVKTSILIRDLMKSR